MLNIDGKYFIRCFIAKLPKPIGYWYETNHEIRVMFLVKKKYMF